MTQAEALGLIASGHRVIVRLWGDDPVSDDLLVGPYALHYYATAGGLQFSPFRENRLSTTRPPATLIEGQRLNEDDLYYAPTSDEVYAGVRLVNARGATVRAAESSRVFKQFPLTGSPAGTCKQRGY